ncbi:MAG: hypothetical protein M3R09_03775 [Actinomycetota bacterium]|nr:hypothetical protein [Actinomycetota bacterium]
MFELLRLFGDGDACDELRWRDDGAGLMFKVDCSDTFYWGTADSENVTEADLPELHRAVTDASGCQAGRDLWPVLWCARKRGMRPMDVFYRRVLGGPPDSGVPGTLAALFDAAGRARPSTLEAP